MYVELSSRSQKILKLVSSLSELGWWAFLIYIKISISSSAPEKVVLENLAFVIIELLTHTINIRRSAILGINWPRPTLHIKFPALGGGRYLFY